MTTFVEGFRPYLIAITFAFLGVAFFFAYRKRPGADASSKPSTVVRLNRAMLWTVTVVAVVFLFVPDASQRLFASNDAFTADMRKTIIQVEGMT